MNEDKDLITDLAIRYITENYTPIGEIEKKEYVTSADIVRELSEMVIISIAEITQLMDSAGFEIKFIDGKPNWVVYLK